MEKKTKKAKTTKLPEPQVIEREMPFEIAVNHNPVNQRVLGDFVLGNDRFVIYIPKHERN